MEEMNEEKFVPSPELAAAILEATKKVTDRSFQGRNPGIGKMIKCPACGLRHRQAGQTSFFERFDPVGKKTVTVETITTPCKQVFTYRMGVYELLKEIENEDGEMVAVPDYRTFGGDGERPTRNQIMGAPRKSGFSANRIKAHPSKMKLRFIEETRRAFNELDFSLETDKETFDKNLHVARQVAAVRIRADHKAAKSAKRFASEHSRRINRGLENPGSRYRNRDRTALVDGKREIR